MKKRKLMLDCDPGHDDAIAIMLAGLDPAIDLVGLTVSAGNQTLEKTGKNALNLVQYLNLDVPVALGSPTPLVRKQQIAADIHGESGLDGFAFPPLSITHEKRHAVTFIIETLKESKEKITMVTTGPMTNLALALKLDPIIVENIEEIVFMGGAIGYGNVSPAAEFNVLVDPEAAHIVVSAGIKTTMVGLDVTRKVKVLPEIITRMEKLNTKASKLFVDLMQVFNENQKKVFGMPGGPLHDPVTIAHLLDETLLTLKHVRLDIDLSHGNSYGRTNCDMFDYLGKKRNAHVATNIDVERFWDIIETSLKRY